LSKLRKDNTGYDLKQLFLGSEGTLGIITAAVLKLFAQPREQAVAWVAVPDVAAAVGVLQGLRDEAGDELVSCELISATALALVLEHIPGSRPPLASPHPWHVLIELTSARREARLQAQLADILQRQSEQGLIVDAVLAGNQAQADALWRLRDSIPEAQRRAGASIKHDVAVPIANVPALIEQATRLVLAQDPRVRVCPFGHLGDGNIHLNLSQSIGADPHAFLAQWPAYNRLIHDLVMTLEGSISAEHGIGQLKREELLRYESPVAIDLMRTLKRALDPHDLLNPGKVIP
jgi:FAD/FMN-containing dehydrogenase